jgi:hypothetical protein
MRRFLVFLIGLHFSISAASYVNYIDCKKNKNITFFLSTPKSGTNVISGCLCALTRKPISWFYWGNSPLKEHISYNRLGLPLITETPLLYRTHYEFTQLMRVPSNINRLIFITRNPKELLYRRFFLEDSTSSYPTVNYIKKFLDEYLEAFEVYNSWCPDTRKLVFYEDFIVNQNETLLQLLEFMKEEPTYLEDFLENRDEYISQLLNSYTTQHTHNLGGSSSKDVPKAIYYTKNIDKDQLKLIDEFIKKESPDFWEKYLNRFETR